MRYWFVILLAGCGGGGGGDDPGNHGYGFQYDSVSAAGMKIRGTDPGLDKLYAETQACTGLTAPAPFVIIVPPKSLSAESHGGAVGFGGEYLTAPSLVLLDLSLGNYMKHESIHYLQDVVQGVTDPNHTSPLWKCE